MSQHVLRATGISKTFERMVMPGVMLQDRLLRWYRHRERIRIPALAELSFALKRGEWVGLYGSNGSGKTTLLRLLSGLMPSDTGTIERHGSFACFFDLSVGFHPERAARENLYFYGLLHGMSAEHIKRLIPQILAFAGLSDVGELPFKCFSSGMQLRLAFAAVSYIESETFLLDEVAAVGDVAFQDQCLDRLADLKKAGKSAVLVSHAHGHLERVCDRILYVDHGRLVSKEGLQPADVLQEHPELAVVV
jgi:lipopolysaccharide transport system ATP-binding protein